MSHDRTPKKTPAPVRSRGPVISRRSFVERLGLGGSALLLSPIAETLVNEARGQVADRKVVVFVLAGNGIHPDWMFTPPELVPAGNGPEGTQYDVKAGSELLANAPTQFTLPPMFNALAAYRSRMLLIDGLANRVSDSGHSGNYGCLSTMKCGESAPPLGITIDQYLAQSPVGAKMPRKSLLFGVSLEKVGPDGREMTVFPAQTSSVFASGKGTPEPHFLSPQAMFTDVFKGIAPPPAAMGAPAGPNLGKQRQKILLDSIRPHIKKMYGAFAGTERTKLDVYLASLDEFEKQQAALGMLGGSCMTPVSPAAMQKMSEDAMASMWSMANVALTCGITNVVGVSCGCGPSHDKFPELDKVFNVDWGGVGHLAQPMRVPALNALWNWLGGFTAQTIQTLQSIKVGNGTLWDNAVFVLLSENGEEHHANYHRWPVALFGNLGGKLKADGRFIRYPKDNRGLCDLWNAIATAAGVPTATFGMGGTFTPKGPLELVMA